MKTAMSSELSKRIVGARAVFRGHYGVRYVLQLSHDGRRRFELYVGNDGCEEGVWSFCKGEDDLSRPHSIYSGDRYDGQRCSCCFLGAAHSVDAHDAETSKAPAKGGA